MEVTEGDDDAYEGTHERREGIGDGGGYLVGVADEAVHDITAVTLLSALPYAVHESGEDASLHHVLTLDAEERGYPASCEAEGYVGDGYEC